MKYIHSFQDVRTVNDFISLEKKILPFNLGFIVMFFLNFPPISLVIHSLSQAQFLSEQQGVTSVLMLSPDSPGAYQSGQWFHFPHVNC